MKRFHSSVKAIFVMVRIKQDFGKKKASEQNLDGNTNEVS
jgi:hypothetical protein